MLFFRMNFLLGALGLVLSAGLWIYFILKKDKIEREPLLTFILVGLGGGVISIVFASLSSGFFTALTGIRFVNEPLAVPVAAALSLFVGFSEEFFKCAAAMVLVRKLKEFDEPADGIIYAMAVSLGFAVIENIGYMVQNGVTVLIPRTFLAVPGHLGFGAVWGAGLAAAKFRHPKANMLRVVAPYLGVSALCHALYDFWLFAFLPLRGIVVAALVLLLWSYASRTVRLLVARSPFLLREQCPECGALGASRAFSASRARVCVACGAAIDPPVASLTIDGIAATLRSRNSRDGRRPHHPGSNKEEEKEG
jgi:protease PrsW